METSLCGHRKIHTWSWISQLQLPHGKREMGTRQEFLGHLDCRKNGLKRFPFYSYFLCIFTGICEKKNAALFPHQLSGMLQISKISVWGWGLLPYCWLSARARVLKDQFTFKTRKKILFSVTAMRLRCRKWGDRGVQPWPFCWGGLLNSFVSWPRSFLVSPWGEQRGSQEMSCCPFPVLGML